MGSTGRGHLRERVLVASFDGVRRLVEAGLGLSILPAAAMPAGGALATRPLAAPGGGTFGRGAAARGTPHRAVAAGRRADPRRLPCRMTTGAARCPWAGCAPSRRP